MMPEETFVEIAAGSADRFATLIGKKGDLERGIRVRRVDGTPDFARDAKPAHRGQKSEHKSEKKDWSRKAGKPKFEKRPEGFKKKRKPKHEA
jgi:ATP-dependent RNA helicase DeaD